MIAGNFSHERELREGLMEALAHLLEGRPLGPDLVLDQAAARARSGDAGGGLRAVQAWLGDASAIGLSKLRRAALLMGSGDLRLHTGDADGALVDWRAVQALPVADHVLRSLRVRVHLSQTEAGRSWLRESMLLGSPPGRWRHRVDALLEAVPADPIARYLHARAYLFRDESGGAARSLSGLLPALTPRWPLLAAAARRLLALHAARLGQCRRANGWLKGDETTGQHAWRAELERTCAAAAVLTAKSADTRAPR